MVIKRFVNFHAARKIIAIGLLAGSLALLAEVKEGAAQNHNLPRGGSMPGSTSGNSSGTPAVTPASNNSPAPANSSGVTRILATYGLIPTACNVGLVQVMVSLQESVCAYPTSQFPSGTYVLNQQDFSLRPIGTSAAPIQPPPPTTSTAMPQTMSPGLYQSPPASTQPPVVTPATPAIITIGNPTQPVPADISAQISASMTGRGLTPVSCSANPGVTVVVGSYMACAYPTTTYPAGQYTLR